MAKKTRNGPRPTRSQAARDRILEAGRLLFGNLGYERTTIRAVAAEADIHPSMVMRYYGTKRDLFAATATFRMEIPDLTRVPRDHVGKTLVRHFLRAWQNHPEELPALLRVAVTHEQARRRLLSLVRERLAPALARVCGRDRAGVCSGLVVSQLVGLALTRQLLRVPSVVDLPEEIVIERIGATIQDYLTRPVSTRTNPRRGPR